MTYDPALQEHFDCSTLDEQTREIVLRKTDETRGLMIRTTEHIIATGENLLTVQKQLPEVNYLRLLVGGLHLGSAATRAYRILHAALASLSDAICGN